MITCKRCGHEAFYAPITGWRHTLKSSAILCGQWKVTDFSMSPSSAK